MFALKKKNTSNTWYVGKSVVLTFHIHDDDDNNAEIISTDTEKSKVKKEKYEVLPIRITKIGKGKHDNLLMSQNFPSKQSHHNFNHFVYIRNLSRLELS